METKTFTVPNISCGHCVRSIQNELGELQGVESVKGDAENKTITIVWSSPATESEIRNIMQSINYPAS
ncbi:MAG: cation transporter [Desulfobacteraceae bacterium]|nr:MAG: cation transporter [Desulfobacteraceae bacterium]